MVSGGDTQNNSAGSISPMGISEIKNSIQEVSNELVLGETPLDFIAFDTCLMGNIETISEFKDLAKYYFASAEIDYGDGWDYTSALSIFSSSPTSSISELAPALVSSWDDHHANAGEMDMKNRTQIAVDLTQLDSFLLQTGSFLAKYSFDELARSLSRSNPGYGIRNELDGLYTTQSYKDLGQFFSLMQNSSDLEMAGDAYSLLSFLESNVIKAQSLGEIRNGAQVGLSVEARLHTDWDEKKSDYLNLFWNSRINWSEFLDDVSTTIQEDSTAPSLLTSAINTENPDASNQPRISFSTNDSDVDNVQLIIKRSEGGTDYSLGLIGFGFVQDQENYNYTWNGKIYRLSNGTLSSDITLSLMGSPGQKVNGDTIIPGFRIPGVISNGETEYYASLVGTQSPFKTLVLTVNNQQAAYDVSKLSGFGYSFTPILKIDQFPYTELGTPLEITDEVSEFTLEQFSASPGTYIIETILSDFNLNKSYDSDSINVGISF